MPYVYILQCSDGTYYTGYTVDIRHRLGKHNQGLASKYTRTRLPVECVYLEEWGTKSEAMSREAQIKSMSRPNKENLIKNNTPPMMDE